VAIYRDRLDTLPAGVGPEAASAARDTLGGAVAAAAELPADTAAALLALANEAFVTGMRVSTGIGVVVAAALVVLAAVGLHTPKQTAADGEAAPEVPLDPALAVVAD
jgi:DHA2 family multidrug resistance protein-like MFS transporter